MSSGDWIALFTFAFSVIVSVIAGSAWLLGKHGDLKKELEQVRSDNVKFEQERLRSEVAAHTEALKAVSRTIIDVSKEILSTRREISELKDQFSDNFVDLVELINQGRVTQVDTLPGSSDAFHIHNKKPGSKK